MAKPPVKHFAKRSIRTKKRFPERAANRITSWRLWLLTGCLVLGALALVWRLVDLTIINRQFLVKQGHLRTLRMVEIPAYRGMITDRNGKPLAISTPVDSIWVDPAQFNPSVTQFNQLASLLKLKLTDIKHQVDSQANRNFVYLKRGNPPDISQQVMALQIPGVFSQREYKRSYPEGEVTAHLVGLTNIDDHGQEGMELAYDQWLAGNPGKNRWLRIG